MIKTYTVTLDIIGSTKENPVAFETLVDEAFMALKKSVAELNNVISLKAVVDEVQKLAVILDRAEKVLTQP